MNTLISTPIHPSSHPWVHLIFGVLLTILHTLVHFPPIEACILSRIQYLFLVLFSFEKRYKDRHKSQMYDQWVLTNAHICGAQIIPGLLFLMWSLRYWSFISGCFSNTLSDLGVWLPCCNMPKNRFIKHSFIH